MQTCWGVFIYRIGDYIQLSIMLQYIIYIRFLFFLFVFLVCNLLLFMQLDPSTVWLREESGSRAFFPDSQNSHFVLSHDVGIMITDLVAMGSAAQGTASFAPSAARVPSISPSLASEPSTSGTPLQAVRKTQSSSVKIIQASVKRLANGKMDFTSHNQTFVDVTEATANM